MAANRLIFLTVLLLAVTVPVFAGPYSTYTGVGSTAVDQPIAATDPRIVEWALNTNYIYSPAPGVGIASPAGKPAHPGFQNPAGFMSLGDLYDPANPPATGVTAGAGWHMGYKRTGIPYPFNGNIYDTTDTYGFIGIDNPGSMTVTFAKAIYNGTGPDFVAFENGFFADPPITTGFFAELAYVEVSSNGTDFARFDSVSLNTGYGVQGGGWDMSNIYNLAGKHNKGLGTPFDLAELVTDPLVAAGLLDLNNVQYVRLVDIPGSGYFQDNATSVIDPTTGQFYTANHAIYDPWVTYDSGGYDFRFTFSGSDTPSLGVLNAVPEPGSLVLFGTAALGYALVVARRRCRIE